MFDLANKNVIVTGATKGIGYGIAAVFATAGANVAVAARSLYDLDLRTPTAWVFGNEGQGVRPELLACVPMQVLIPMPGATESLNVAAAAAICLFEAVRQRLPRT